MPHVRENVGIALGLSGLGGEGRSGAEVLLIVALGAVVADRRLEAKVVVVFMVGELDTFHVTTGGTRLGKICIIVAIGCGLVDKPDEDGHQERSTNHDCFVVAFSFCNVAL